MIEGMQIVGNILAVVVPLATVRFLLWVRKAGKKTDRQFTRSAENPWNSVSGRARDFR